MLKRHPQCNREEKYASLIHHLLPLTALRFRHLDGSESLCKTLPDSSSHTCYPPYAHVIDRLAHHTVIHLTYRLRKSECSPPNVIHRRDARVDETFGDLVLSLESIGMCEEKPDVRQKKLDEQKQLQDQCRRHAVYDGRVLRWLLRRAGALLRGTYQCTRIRVIHCFHKVVRESCLQTQRFLWSEFGRESSKQIRHAVYIQLPGKGRRRLIGAASRRA